MMGTKVMTFALVGGAIGLFLDGAMVGALTGVLMYISIQLEEYLKQRN
ncbi:hypothetical protein ABE137_23920 [Brevibacillus laterosporus]|nr:MULTISPECIES: hypothetical protein [Brevibacillus]MCR8985362.1 hypothetical protein [Brevibacillus laterosporus]GIN99993.1 hypothetical protein J5TS2_06620 [Brevibacillus halotolerans]